MTGYTWEDICNLKYAVNQERFHSK